MIDYFAAFIYQMLKLLRIGYVIKQDYVLKVLGVYFRFLAIERKLWVNVNLPFRHIVGPTKRIQ